MNGKAHSLMTVSAGLVLPIGYLTSHILELKQVPFLTLGTFFGLLLNCDADVDNGSISDYYIRRIFGTDFFYDIWLKPYRKSIKHRSFWSHTPIIGTIIRLLYIVCPFIILLVKDQPTKSRVFVLDLIFAQIIGIGILSLLIFLNNRVDVVYWISPIILGLTITDLLHFLADMW